MEEKVFINGLISKDIPETTPDWVLGKHSIKVQELIDWLTANKNLADENGWINLVTKRSQKTGKRFMEVDTWKPTKQEVVNKLTGQDAEDNKKYIEDAKKIQEQYQKDLEKGKAMIEEIPF